MVSPTMSESEKLYYTSPPPPYEEAVHGAPPPQASNGISPLINNPIHISQPPTSQVTYNPQSQYIRQQQHTHYSPPPPPPPQVDASYPYYRCPRGMEPLLDLDEILVYTSREGKYKIKDCNKHLIMKAKLKWDDDCCDCCSCVRTMRFHLITLQESYAAECACITDAVNICSSNPMHLEVMCPPDVSIGTVWIKSQYNCTIVNQSGDLLFTLTRQSHWFHSYPYQIYSANGMKVGQIDNSRGIKNRITLPKETPIQHKIIILFYALYVQSCDDSDRSSSS